jgi:ABC-type branched-subunit amino acid transport system substrate-binding protein
MKTNDEYTLKLTPDEFRLLTRIVLDSEAANAELYEIRAKLLVLVEQQMDRLISELDATKLIQAMDGNQEPNQSLQTAFTNYLKEKG